MLISFKASNFKSILEPVCLSMIPDAEDKSLSERLYEIQGMDISPIAVIMGPNGSGKSTILDAFLFTKDIALRKIKPSDIQRNKLALDKPSYFEICMCFEESVIGEAVQKYTIEIDPTGIVYESLWCLNNDEWKILYDENHYTYIGIDSEATDNSSLPVQFEDVKKFYNSVISYDQIKNSLDEKGNPFIWADTNGNLKIFKEILKQSLNELGVKVVDIDFPNLLIFLKDNGLLEPERCKGREAEAFKFYIIRGLVYDGYSVPLKEESAGTKRLLTLMYIIIEQIFCNERGITFILDELGAGLHDTLSTEIVKQFFKICELCKNCKSQLIATTHNTTLLRDKILRKDQIWLTEMKENRTTDLFSLAELKGVKATEDFAENYLRGKYGALPPRQEWAKKENETDD